MGLDGAVVTLLPPTGSPDELTHVGYDAATWDQPQNLARGQLTTAERMPSVELGPGGPAVVLPPGAELEVGRLSFTDPLTGRAMTGDQFLDRRLYTDALAVMQDGRLVYETYCNGMVETDRLVASGAPLVATAYLLASLTAGLAATVLGMTTGRLVVRRDRSPRRAR